MSSNNKFKSDIIRIPNYLTQNDVPKFSPTTSRCGSARKDCRSTLPRDDTYLNQYPTAAREFDEFERYYEIEKKNDYDIRKEFYINNYLSINRITPPLRKRIGRKKVDFQPSKCFGRARSINYYVNRNINVNSLRAEQNRPSLTVKNELTGMLADLTPLTFDDTGHTNCPVMDKIQSTSTHMTWDNYHRLDVIYNFMSELEDEHPSLCTTGVIGKTLEGRDIKILKISNSESTNAAVWIDAGIHAREWIAPAVNTYIANHIARNFDNLSCSVRNKDWYFLPVVNPDGYEYSHTTNRMWRKNKACDKDSLHGVDLNRNFSYGWGGKGSSDQPKHPFYRGPRPFSEPETAALRDIFTKSGLTFKVYVTLHSFGQVIVMPFAYSDCLAPDYIRLLEGATAMSKAIYNTNGNTYKVGISKDVMYPASGTSTDWSHGAIGIPFCYLIELRSKQHKFRLPKEEIVETGAEILNCVLALMEFVDNYKAPTIQYNCLQPDTVPAVLKLDKEQDVSENQFRGDSEHLILQPDNADIGVPLSSD